VYQRIRNAVLDGTLAPGARLPSSRSLAGQLSIARGTIELAYALLADEGYVAGMRRTGTIVNVGLSRKSMSPGNRRRSYGRCSAEAGAPVSDGLAGPRRVSAQGLGASGRA
jgi:GntR family transcriptional regulator/MocR family aminotransferase